MNSKNNISIKIVILYHNKLWKHRGKKLFAFIKCTSGQG